MFPALAAAVSPPQRHSRCRPAVSQRGPSARSRRVPRKLLDACHDLPEQGLCQVAFGELQGEVPRMPDEASARVEQPLLEAREGPALDGDRQDQPTQQDCRCCRRSPRGATGPRWLGSGGKRGASNGFLAFLDPLLSRPALGVEADDRLVRPRERGDDEDHPGKHLPEGDA